MGRPKDSSGEKGDKKWITCQITEDEHEKLETYCSENTLTKTEVIRDFLQNIDTYAVLIKLVKRRVLKSLKQELEDLEVTEEKPEVTSDDPLFIPNELSETAIDADLSEIFK